MMKQREIQLQNRQYSVFGLAEYSGIGVWNWRESQLRLIIGLPAGSQRFAFFEVFVLTEMLSATASRTSDLKADASTVSPL